MLELIQHGLYYFESGTASKETICLFLCLSSLTHVRLKSHVWRGQFLPPLLVRNCWIIDSWYSCVAGWQVHVQNKSKETNSFVYESITDVSVLMYVCPKCSKIMCLL